MDREIKVTKCGEIQNSLFNDRVSIEFTPFELETLKKVFKERAMNANHYDEQGNERDKCGVFTKAYEVWEKARKEKNK